MGRAKRYYLAGMCGTRGIDAIKINILLFEVYVKSEKERIRRYRKYVYEAGAVNRPEKGRSRVIGEKIIKRERKREFELSRNDRFRYRTRYFTDSGVIGTKEFVSKTYVRFKHHFN